MYTLIPEHAQVLMLTKLQEKYRRKMAEREGFEPSMRFYPHTPLAGERLQPLGHLSKIKIGIVLGTSPRDVTF